MAKTPEGKARSSRNALKHGMFSTKQLVLDDESAAEFEAVRRGWLGTYRPAGYLEDRLVNQLIFNDWMLQRANRRLMEAEFEGDRHQVELMQRYKNTAERSFYRALHAVEGLWKEKRRLLVEMQRERERCFRKEDQKARPGAPRRSDQKFPRAG